MLAEAAPAKTTESAMVPAATMAVATAAAAPSRVRPPTDRKRLTAEAVTRAPGLWLGLWATAAIYGVLGIGTLLVLVHLARSNRDPSPEGVA